MVVVVVAVRWFVIGASPSKLMIIVIKFINIGAIGLATRFVFVAGDVKERK